MGKKCEHVDDGKRCGAWAMEGSDFCFAHDPERREEFLQASAEGGAAGRYEWKEAEEIEDIVIDQLTANIHTLRSMRASPENARALTAALVALDRALERREKKVDEQTEVVLRYENDWMGRNTIAENFDFCLGRLWKIVRHYDFGEIKEALVDVTTAFSDAKTAGRMSGEDMSERVDDA